MVRRAEALGEIELLVNNAGVATGGDFLGASLDREIGAVRLNVEALVTPSAKGWDKRLKDLRRLLHDLGAKVHRYDGGSAK